jgi:carbamoyl-phosphate synthase large subunit
MRSTGEVLGMAESFGLAFEKALQGAKLMLPDAGTVLFSICQIDRSEELVETVRHFQELGFAIRASDGTHRFLAEHGVSSQPILKLYEGRPNIVDSMKNDEIHLIVNTPVGKLAVWDDSYIRKESIKRRIPCIHTVAAAKAAAEGIAARRKGHMTVTSLQSYHQAPK